MKAGPVPKPQSARAQVSDVQITSKNNPLTEYTRFIRFKKAFDSACKSDYAICAAVVMSLAVGVSGGRLGAARQNGCGVGRRSGWTRAVAGAAEAVNAAVGINVTAVPPSARAATPILSVLRNEDILSSVKGRPAGC